MKRGISGRVSVINGAYDEDYMSMYREIKYDSCDRGTRASAERSGDSVALRYALGSLSHIALYQSFPFISMSATATTTTRSAAPDAVKSHDMAASLKRKRTLTLAGGGTSISHAHLPEPAFQPLSPAICFCSHAPTAHLL